MNIEKLNIVRNNQSIAIEKENKTRVNYFIFDEYEIHLNTIPANSIQEWHYHRAIEEVLLVTKGQLTCKWLEDGKMFNEVINVGDIVQVKNSIHTLQNNTLNDCDFVVFRFVPDRTDKRELIKNDKKIVEINEEKQN